MNLSKEDAFELGLLVNKFREDLVWDEDNESDALLMSEQDQIKWLKLLEKIKAQSQ